MSEKKTLDLVQSTIDGLGAFGAHSIANRVALVEVIKALTEAGIMNVPALAVAFKQAAESAPRRNETEVKVATEVDKQLRSILVDVTEDRHGEGL